MEPTVATFAEEVARLIRASDDHPAVALCQLAQSRTIFTGVMTDLRNRLPAIPAREGRVGAPAELEPLPQVSGTRISLRTFRRFLCTVIFAAIAMAALGYYVGQSPATWQNIRLPNLIDHVERTWHRVWPASRSPVPPANPEDGA